MSGAALDRQTHKRYHVMPQKTQYYTASSLDGFLADADNNLDWLFQFGEGPPPTDYEEFIDAVGALAMGSTTYEWILRHQVMRAVDPIPWPYAQPTWVFTTRELQRVPGADIRFVRGDVRPVHEEMARVAGERNVWLMGGGDLVGQFHDQGLLDEMIVFVASVVLGAGAPLLPRRITAPPLALLEVKALGSAFARLRYEVPKASA